MAFARKMNPCHFEILVANFLREEEEERVKKAMKRLALYRINRVINRNNCLCVLRDYILVAKFRRKHAANTIKRFVCAKAMKYIALYRINRVINRNNCLCVLRDYILVAKFRRKHAVRKICKFLSDYILFAKFRRKHAVRKICKFLKCLKTLKIRVFIKAFRRALLPQNSRNFLEFQVKIQKNKKITLYMLRDESSFLDGAIFNKYYTLQPVYDGSKKGIVSMFNKPSNLKFPKALRNNPTYFLV